MNEQASIEGHAFNLRQMRALRAEHKPETIDDFFLLLEMRARIDLESETLARQVEQAELNERKVD